MELVMEHLVLVLAGAGLLASLFMVWLGVRYVPNDKLAVVEKLWGSKSLSEGEIIAVNGEAGFQPDVLRGGFHLFYWRWQYKFHKRRLITIREGKIGYVFSRAGTSLSPTQTLGQVVECNSFQNSRAFLANGGQKGRQRAILREGVYAVNLAVFNVIAEDAVYSLDSPKNLQSWQQELMNCHGFDPVRIGNDSDDIGIVTTQDGPSLNQGEIIAPPVGTDKNDPFYHARFQDIEKFLAAGGRRGLQYDVLLDGSYFINRWFATVVLKPKFVVPIGSVGVVVSYYGKTGQDTSGTKFRHGERVHEGERGVWESTLGPGKYPFNPYAGNIVLVPTTNFVLHWITGKTEGHKYDESLKSIDLITKDAYEPILPLSVVVHCDYQKAPNVIQRFGDVKQLITQTIDPLLSAFFRDVAHKKTMLELVHSRDEIQKQARQELRDKFTEFDIECIDVLIGRPESAKGDNKIENLLEQLRLRQLSLEQIETYSKQEAAAEKEKSLNDAQSKALFQKELTSSSIKIQIATNEAEADLARARKTAEKTVVTAEAEAKKLALEGKGKGELILSVGQSEAEVLQKKINSFGNSNLYAMSVIAEFLSNSKQPLVPATSMGGGTDNGGVLNLLMSLMVKEKLEDKTAPSSNGEKVTKK